MTRTIHWLQSLVGQNSSVTDFQEGLLQLAQS